MRSVSHLKQLSWERNKILCMNGTANDAITNISTGAESVAVPTVGHTKEVKSLRCQSKLKIVNFLKKLFSLRVTTAQFSVICTYLLY